MPDRLCDDQFGAAKCKRNFGHEGYHRDGQIEWADAKEPAAESEDRHYGLYQQGVDRAETLKSLSDLASAMTQSLQAIEKSIKELTREVQNFRHDWKHQ